MIRKILFRRQDKAVYVTTTPWFKGVIHAFLGDSAVVEDLDTGELELVEVSPQTLKFEIATEKWEELLAEARAQRLAREKAEVDAALSAAIHAGGSNQRAQSP